LVARARPAYPEELFDDLMRLAGLSQGSQVVETGQAQVKQRRTWRVGDWR